MIRTRRGGRYMGMGQPTIKDLQLDVEATLTEAIYGHGHAHYGFWPDGMPAALTLQALGAAQQAYCDFLVRQIPEGTRTILDIGSGTGSNALALARLGYRLECLCPSDHLNAIARAKLPASIQVHNTTFEEFQSKRQFDLCLFAESFHYIELEKAIEQITRYAARDVLIFDYFRKERGRPGDSTRCTHSAFLSALRKQTEFEIAHDQDLSDEILPTFAVLDHIKADLLSPLLARSRATLRAAYPVRAWLGELVFGRKLDKIQGAGRRSSSFAERFEYRLIRLNRR